MALLSRRSDRTRDHVKWIERGSIHLISEHLELLYSSLDVIGIDWGHGEKISIVLEQIGGTG